MTRGWTRDALPVVAAVAALAAITAIGRRLTRDRAETPPYGEASTDAS